MEYTRNVFDFSKKKVPKFCVYCVYSIDLVAGIEVLG